MKNKSYPAYEPSYKQFFIDINKVMHMHHKKNLMVMTLNKLK